MKKNIGLLTIHHTYNYGAMLQAYATYFALQKLGNSVELIDFDNNTFEEERNIFLPCNSIKNLLRNLRTLINYKRQVKRKSNFEDFYSKMKVSPKHYNNEYGWDVTRYDVVLTGSDQTFCLYLTDVPEEMKPFFLNHVKGVKKASYASSMGEKFHKLSESDKIWLQESFQSFDYISVRERKSADYINSLIGIKPQIVLDPVFLLSANEWDVTVSKAVYPKGDYIAFYTVLSEQWVIQYAERIAQITKLPVIALHPRTRFELTTKFNYATENGPEEFVSIIKNAKYVITTSFHATVFSIIFNKLFVSLSIGEGNRLSSLLNMLSLDDRLIKKDNAVPNSLLNAVIDYSVTNNRLKEEIEKSYQFIETALGN